MYFIFMENDQSSPLTYLVFIHFFFDPYRFVQIVYQQIRLIVASDGPHIILDGGNVLQVHADVGKRFPLIIERRQCENLPVVINSQHALQFVHLLVMPNVQTDSSRHNGLIAISCRSVDALSIFL